MKRRMHKWLCCGLSLILLLAVLPGCQKKEKAYPDGTINLIIPYSAGGNADTVGRMVAQYLGEELGVQIVCVNKPGSSGELGAMEIASAKPDGYTIGLLNSPDFIISDLVNPDFDFAFADSVHYIASFTKTPFSYYAQKGSEIDTWEKFVAHCKANPGKVTVGEGGIAHRVLAAAIMEHFGIAFTTINFSGASDVVAALLGGHVDAASSGNQQLSSFLAGNCVPIAWGGEEPCQDLPNTPMFKDEGLSIDFLAVCNTIVAPKGIPGEALQKLTAACEKISQNQELIDQITATGYTYSARTGDALTQELTGYYEIAKGLCEQYKELILAQ